MAAQANHLHPWDRVPKTCCDNSEPKENSEAHLGGVVAGDRVVVLAEVFV